MPVLVCTPHDDALISPSIPLRIISVPSQAGRVEIMKIHGAPITKKGDIGTSAHPHSCMPSSSVASRNERYEADCICTDYESVVKLADGFNAADLRNVCTEAGMFAIRAERDYVIEEDFMKAVSSAT